MLGTELRAPKLQSHLFLPHAPTFRALHYAAHVGSELQKYFCLSPSDGYEPVSMPTTKQLYNKKVTIEEGTDAETDKIK